MSDQNALLGTIERYGWALQYVLEQDPARSFGYTVGLSRRGLPELVVAGLTPEQSWTVLNDVAGRSTGRGEQVRPGAVLTDVIGGYALHVEPLEDLAALTRLRELGPCPERPRALRLVPVPVGPAAPTPGPDADGPRTASGSAPRD